MQSEFLRKRVLTLGFVAGVSVEMWMDFGCPYSRMSLVEFRRFLADSPFEVDMKLRCSRIDPGAPSDYGKTTVENLCNHLGITEAEALEMLQHVVDIGKTVDVDFDFQRARGANTFDAHRLLKLAARHGVHVAFADAVFTAHFERGLLISDHDVLVALAVEAGLDANEARGVLASQKFAQDVIADETEAVETGVERTPYVALEGCVRVAGMQTRDNWFSLLDPGS